MCFHFSFSSLISIPIEITSSAIGIKICTITAGIKKCKLIIKKTKKKHDKIVFLTRPELNSIKVSIFNALMDSVISHEELSNK